MKTYSYLLFAAMDRGDVSEVENLVRSGYCSPWDYNKIGVTAMAYLTRLYDKAYNDRTKNSYVKMMEAMLLKDEDVNLAHAKSHNAGRQNVKHPLPEYLKLLDEASCSPLLRATKKMHGKLMTKLLKCDACLNAQDSEGRSPLMMNLANYKKLLKHGGDIELRDSLGFTALMRAIKSGDSVKAKSLIESGACINAVSNDDQTPLSLALDRHAHGAYFKLVMNDNFPGRVSTLHKLFNLGADVSLSQKSQNHLATLIYIGRNDLTQMMLVGGCIPQDLPYDQTARFRAYPMSHRQACGAQLMSPLQIALISFNARAARFFLANRFLTENDVSMMSRNEHIKEISSLTDVSQLDDDDPRLYGYLVNSNTFGNRRSSVLEETKKLIRFIAQSPLSLFTLSHVAVTSALRLGRADSVLHKEKDGVEVEEKDEVIVKLKDEEIHHQSKHAKGKKRRKAGCSSGDSSRANKRSRSDTASSSRSEQTAVHTRVFAKKVHSLPLPPALKRSLSFQTPSISVCSHQWHTLPLDNL